MGEEMGEDYYNKNAEAFFNGSVSADMSSVRALFLTHVRKGGHILDAGCGSGRDSVAFLQAGYEVTGMDASDEMVRMSSELTRPWGGKPTLKRRFQEIEETEAYDGIWACASLLHVLPEELPEVFARLVLAMKSGGVLYASFKQGTGVIERDGRSFTMMTEDDLQPVSRDVPGLKCLQVWSNVDVRPERNDEHWVNAMWKKSDEDE